MAEYELMPSPVQRAATPTPTGTGLLLLAGNRAVTNLMAQREGDNPPPTQQELDDVVGLMPINSDIDTLVMAVESECGRWNGWRGTMQGEIPGNVAFAAMNQFKDAVRAKDFDYTDPRIMAACQRRLTGHNPQLLTEMCAFSLGADTGDSTGLAKVFGVQAPLLNHTYTLKIEYSMGPKVEILGNGVSYTYRSAGIFYSNNLGMAYDKPLSMRSFVASLGADTGASTYSVGGSGEGTADSAIFWLPEDFETDFMVVKGAASGAVGQKEELKVLEAIRVNSDKHPALVFDMMSGSALARDEGYEAGWGAGAGIELEGGRMFGSEEIGPVTVKAPDLHDSDSPKWQVLTTSQVPFATGLSLVTSQGNDKVLEVARAMDAWHKANPDGEMRVEIIGRASPRWRHPKRGQIKDDLNLKLSKDRALAAKGALTGALWAATMVIDAEGEAGPVMDLDEERTSLSGVGDIQAQAELADPENDDARYRVADVTVRVKKAAPPKP